MTSLSTVGASANSGDVRGSHGITWTSKSECAKVLWGEEKHRAADTEVGSRIGISNSEGYCLVLSRSMSA